MKLLLVGKPWRGRWLDYVHAACVELGHEVRVFHTTGNGPADRWLRRLARHTASGLWTRRWQASLRGAVAAFRPDLILVVSATTPDAMVAFLGEVKGDARLFCWFGDDPSKRPGLFGAIDHGFVTDSAHLAALSEAGIGNVSYLAFAASPAHHFPDPGPGPAHDLVFVGDRSPEREALLTPLAGHDLGHYGPGWNRAADPALRRHARPGFVDLPRWRRLYANAVLCLNVHQRVCRAGTNMRSYEIPACGGSALIEWKDDLARDFVSGEEITTFRDPEELAEAAARLLADPSAARKVADAGRARVLAEHTYAHRVGHILARR
jgi:spore maturation protein CgeB